MNKEPKKSQLGDTDLSKAELRLPICHQNGWKPCLSPRPPIMLLPSLKVGPVSVLSAVSWVWCSCQGRICCRPCHSRRTNTNIANGHIGGTATRQQKKKKKSKAGFKSSHVLGIFNSFNTCIFSCSDAHRHKSSQGPLTLNNLLSFSLVLFTIHTWRWLSSPCCMWKVGKSIQSSPNGFEICRTNSRRPW